MADTLLVISAIGVPPYSARGLKQTLDPISASGHMRRTVNGELIDLSVTQFRKYQSSISCDDVNIPAIGGLWPGMAVTVDCVAELNYKTAGGVPERTVVASRVDGDYTFYRPRLVMRVVTFKASKDEYGATTSWQIDLEEE